MQSSKPTIQPLQVYRWLFSFVTPYKRPLVLFLLSGFFLSAVELSVPKFIEWFTDYIAPKRDFGALGIMLCSIGGLFALAIFVIGRRNNYQKILQEKPSMDILEAQFTQLRKLGFSYYEQHPTGETLSMFQEEIGRLQSMYHRYLPGIIHQGTMLIISASLMVHSSLRLSLIVLPCFLSYYLLGPYFERKATLWAKEAQDRRMGANRTLFNSFSSIWELRAYGAKDWDIRRLLSGYRKMHGADNTQNWYAYSRGTVRRVTTGVGAFAVFFYGAYLIQSNKLSIGAFCAVIILYFYVINNLTFLVTLMTEQKIVVAQAEKLYRFAQERPMVEESSAYTDRKNIEGRITFSNVHFSYPGYSSVLNGLDLEIVPGEKLGIVGTSGSGKSSVVKLLGRFYDPTAGEITLDGISLQAWSTSELRESLGFVFQETYLFGTTIRENIRFGKPEATDEEVTFAAQSAYAHDFIMSLPQGYDTLVGERGINLSGGQKQRIAIARMFIKQPAIIVLDEATSALDNASELAVQLALRQLTDGRTTIAVAHRLSTIRDYDRIIVIEDGRMEEAGTYGELVSKRGRFYRLLEGEDNDDESGGVRSA